jgi:hypothetical protein
LSKANEARRNADALLHRALESWLGDAEDYLLVDDDGQAH